MDGKADDKARKRESEEILRRVARESETLGASNLARQVTATPQTEEERMDRMDRIGMRIGRGLGIAVAAGLLVYLYLTYFRH